MLKQLCMILNFKRLVTQTGGTVLSFAIDCLKILMMERKIKGDWKRIDSKKATLKRTYSDLTKNYVLFRCNKKKFLSYFTDIL